MDKPVIVSKKPVMIDLEKGKTYYWCACGKSKNQPFCDGSHKGTSFTPVKFSVEEDSKKAICMCKHTSNKPYCDGTHNKL